MDNDNATALRTDFAADLEARIAARTAVVGVVGLGYVGLPLAVAYARRGYTVRGLDLDAGKVGALAGGRSHVLDVSEEEVRDEIASERLRPTTDPGVLSGCDAVFICVPTPITRQKEPDTRHVLEAAAQVAKHARPGQLIVLRSTSYPGATDEVVRPALEREGFVLGEDVFLAFAPERVDPGNRRFTIDHVPVVAGGCDPASTRLAVRLLEQVCPEVTAVSSPAAAEMTKLLENVFRNVNIALVNQVARLCDRMGLNVWEIVDAASTKPYGFMSFQPGLVGGHCIPVDPYYLAWKAREYDFHMDFIELSARVNEDMPFFVADRVMAALRHNGVRNGVERVVVLGAAFKRDVNDARHSPAVKVMELLALRGVEVAYHDPYVEQVRVNAAVYRSRALTEDLLHGADCVVILTDHACFDYEAIVRHARLVFDARNATRRVTHGREKIIRL